MTRPTRILDGSRSNVSITFGETDVMDVAMMKSATWPTAAMRSQRTEKRVR
jgi:hypothetical protein